MPARDGGRSLARAVRGATHRRWVALLLGLSLPALVRADGEAGLVMIQSAPGRFEIAAVDASVAHGIASLADEAWRTLGAPLGLPEAFPSPVFVRVAPASPDAAPDKAPFRVIVETGGVVSVRLRPDAISPAMVRRALVQGLLMRLAVARHGVNARLGVPLWLELAAVAWWETRADAAELDARKQEAGRRAPPTLEGLLTWQRGADEPPELSTAALWLLTFLQNESGRGREWPWFLGRLLAGEDPIAALAASYPERFGRAEERELWWSTGYHHARRVRTLPALDASESRLQLEGLARFVFAGPTDEADIVVPLRAVLARDGEPVVAAELARRSAELAKLIPALHPFYRNAGLSLADVFGARDVKRERRENRLTSFEQDWGDAIELEAATKAALDQLEAQPRPP